MSEERPFTVSSFYSFIHEKMLKAGKCNECGTEFLPPKPMCTNCLSTNMKWIEVNCHGTLLSYTVIHVAPEQFQSMVPYIVGIVEFSGGNRLPGIIRNVDPEKIKIGMKLKLDFDVSCLSRWPSWSQYFFKPV